MDSPEYALRQLFLRRFDDETIKKRRTFFSLRDAMVNENKQMVNSQDSTQAIEDNRSEAKTRTNIM